MPFLPFELTRTWRSLLVVLLVCLNVLDATNFLAPKIVSLKPQNGVTVVVKGSAIFECQVVSYPLAKISWLKNGKRVSQSASKSSKFKQSHGSNLSILRVNDINHSMNITCVAESTTDDDTIKASNSMITEAKVHVRTGRSII